MISSQPLINKICCALTTGGLTDVQCCQAENALTLLCQPVFSVATFASLPNVITYNGRMVYVDDENKYYYAVLGVWSDDFSSTPYAVRCDLYAWGLNSSGQLGTVNTINRSSPVSVVNGFTDWSQVSACNQSLGVRNNGTLWAWGCNTFGQLGDNTTVSKSSPVSVVGGFTDWCWISTGTNFSQGIRQNGTAWGWGSGSSGKLGDGTIVDKSSPVSVIGGFTDWCQLSVGNSHTNALRSTGSAWGWGFNNCGQIGDGTVTTRTSPVSVVGGFTDWCQISSGNYFSLAVRQNGTAWGWGCNGEGRLGDNTVVNKSSPVSVVGDFTDWCQTSAGDKSSLAVRQNGTAWAWGCATSGRLGDNTAVSKSSPVSVVGGFTDWCQVSAGVSHSLALRTNGTAWGWGANGSGQLGTNNTTSRSSPVSVVGGFTTWAEVRAGASFSLGRTITTVPLQSI
jgi:alpha-tubulin suppressor-like RCC1 family protein